MSGDCRRVAETLVACQNFSTFYNVNLPEILHTICEYVEGGICVGYSNSKQI